MLLGGPEEEPSGRQLLDLDCFLSDISDTLFTMTQPSSAPLQLPPEDGKGLHLESETCENPGGQGRVARGWAAPTPPRLPLLMAPLPPPAYVGNADMIQPDLTPLQPSLDDFMEISGEAAPPVGWGCRSVRKVPG